MNRRMIVYDTVQLLAQIKLDYFLITLLLMSRFPFFTSVADSKSGKYFTIPSPSSLFI